MTDTLAQSYKGRKHYFIMVIKNVAQSYYLFDPRLGAQMWQKDDLLIKNNAQEHYHIFSRPRLGFFLKALLMENIKTRITMASSIYTAKITPQC